MLLKFRNPAFDTLERLAHRRERGVYAVIVPTCHHTTLSLYDHVNEHAATVCVREERGIVRDAVCTVYVCVMESGTLRLAWWILCVLTWYMHVITVIAIRIQP